MSRSRPKLRTVLAVAAVVIVAVVGATAAVAATSSGGHAYRTAVVKNGSVARQLRGSGTIQAVAQAAVAFPIAGRVTSVDVTVGAHVAAGQNLATLDASALQQAVVQKQAALAAAQLTLYKALHGEPVSATGGARSSTNSASVPVTTTAATFGTGKASGSASSGAAGTPSVQRLLTGQQKVDGAITSAQIALSQANHACSSATTGSSPPPGVGPGRHGRPPSTTSTSSSTTTSTVPTTTSTVPTTTPTAPTSGFGTAACIAAQQQLFGAQQVLATAQVTLANAEQAFERALASSSASSGRSSSGSSPNSSASSGGTGSASVPAVSAVRLVAYQAAVDAAAADLLAAQETVAQATITSPIDGTVAAVSLQVGKEVTAASTTANVVVVGGGGYEISTTVGVNDIVTLKVGDAATVVPDGDARALTGKVVWIGAASGSATATTYPVVIGLSEATSGSLRNGALSSTSIEVGHAPVNALTVPTSAVHTTNRLHLVTLLVNGKTSSVAVGVGVVGAATTQITSGLRAGQVVVLADLHAAVPSSNTNSRIVNAITGGGGGGGGALNRGLGG